jgi:hypothetical protein
MRRAKKNERKRLAYSTMPLEKKKEEERRKARERYAKNR